MRPAVGGHAFSIFLKQYCQSGKVKMSRKRLTNGPKHIYEEVLHCMFGGLLVFITTISPLVILIVVRLRNHAPKPRAGFRHRANG